MNKEKRVGPCKVYTELITSLAVVTRAILALGGVELHVLLALPHRNYVKVFLKQFHIIQASNCMAHQQKGAQGRVINKKAHL